MLETQPELAFDRRCSAIRKSAAAVVAGRRWRRRLARLRVRIGNQAVTLSRQNGSTELVASLPPGTEPNSLCRSEQLGSTTHVLSRLRRWNASPRRGRLHRKWIHYTRQEVVDSINAGNTWKTKADGCEAVIEPMSCCPRSGCLAKPYIRTNPDSTNKDNLENLGEC